jgi:hypothetical protein
MDFRSEKQSSNIFATPLLFNSSFMFERTPSLCLEGTHGTMFGKTLWVTDKRTDVWSRPSCIYTQIFSPKKTWFFPHKKYFPKCFWLLFTFILCNFSVQTLKYFQKNFKLFFVHKNFKELASKVAHNRPRPFYFTVQPGPQPIINFWYYEISGPDICSLIRADDTNLGS